MGQRRWKSAWPLAVVGVVSMLGVPGIAGASAAGNANPAAAGSANGVTPVCPGPAAAGFAQCRALLLDNPANWRGQHVTGSKGPGPGPSLALPSGYGPGDLQSAYSLTSASATGGFIPPGNPETVAIVDAYNDPNAARDLTAYRSKFGLPACSAGCFSQVNQNGTTSGLPVGNSGWAEEISLDLDMVSAVCPNCHILLVEASSSSFANLAKAEDTARGWSGVVAISNSYGGSEFSGEASYDSHYTSSTAAITVSSGDGGYGAEYPAASPDVTAVGGTSLKHVSNTGVWTETAWSGAGSGCSTYESRLSSQSSPGIPSSCTKRAVADVSADADPNTGVAVYDSYRESGWLVFGGTSVASPLVASVYALAGNTVGSQQSASLPYSHDSATTLNDVTSGSNGSCASAPALCTAGIGWDGPTGLGTPHGTGAF